MQGFRAVVAGGLTLALWMGACPVQAQDEGDPETERARQLFTEGLGLADEGDWERAVLRFRSALELRESAPVRFNLARSLAQMGRLVEALEESDRILADASVEADVRAAVEELRGEVAPRLGQLEVSVSGERGDALVTVDGRPWNRLGEPVTADPGIRVVRLLHETTELDIHEADVPEGGLARVTLEVPADFYAAGATEAVEGDEGGDDGWVIGLVVGLVVVAVGAGVVTGVVLAQEGQGSTGDFMPGALDVDG